MLAKMGERSLCGKPPIVIGHFELEQPEMMFVQYMPVIMPHRRCASTPIFRSPANLKFVNPLIGAVLRHEEWDFENYLYITAKSLYVTAETMNRPGWHIDGFGTDDVNYIWSDSSPTEFCVQSFDLSEDCDTSMRQMDEQARPENIRTYGEKMLLKLDSDVVHRVPPGAPPSFRTFVKLSISKHRYNLQGNAHNYLFDYDWPMFPREASRNHPFKGATK